MTEDTAIRAASPTQYLTWGQGLLALLMWPLQTAMIVWSVFAGWGYEYTLLWLAGINIFLWRHYSKVANGHKLPWMGLLADYTAVMVLWFSLPLLSTFIALNYFPFPEETIVVFAERNRDFIAWLWDMDLLNVPIELGYYRPPDAMLIYSYTLLATAGVLGAILSIPLWWPMARGWVVYYRKMHLFRRVAFFLFCCLVIILIPDHFKATLDYGYGKIIIEQSGQKYLSREFNNSRLITNALQWSWYMIVITSFASGIIGYFRSINIIKR